MPSPLTFVHLSDIHFGQERGGETVTHTDVRDRLIEDVRKFVVERERSDRAASATGIIITGDIAYSGKETEYKTAGVFLDQLAGAAKCRNTDVQVVPGNHDVDLKAISQGARRMLLAVAENGETELDLYLADDRDRELLYARLAEYRRFADGYGCSLDDEGGHAGEKQFELTPGRNLSFLGLNSALLCSGRDLPGKLLLGTRQRTIPIQLGVERVVVSHHPLHWMSDRAEALRFIRTRARILISGHEHSHDVSVEEVEGGGNFMTVAAGATNPPEVGGPYKFTYNIIDFAWDAECDGLKVTINARAWDDDRKRFMGDFNRFGGRENRAYTLGCPFFRDAPRPALVPLSLVPTAVPTLDVSLASISPEATPRIVNPAADTREVAMTDDPYPRLRLLFFRELDRTQRLRVLVELGALPNNLPTFPTMSIERKALDRARDAGRLAEIEAAIKREIAQRSATDETKPGV